MKKFIRFLRDDEGMEFIQVAVIVLGTIALAAAFYALVKSVGDNIKATGTTIPDYDGGAGWN